MKFVICDICHLNGGKIVKAGWKATVVNNNPGDNLKIYIDACKDHKDIFRGKNYEEAMEMMDKLREESSNK